ncbi:MAG: alpha/beta family hydrolase [Archangium sp.]
MSRATVVMLPGFNGSADQPILVKLEKQLPDFDCVRLAPPRLKLLENLDNHVTWLREATAKLKGPLIFVGRSFGGRLAIRLAAEQQFVAIVLLGFPVRPPSKKRPLDEAALAALTCPTLIVQGTKDELGPLSVLEPIVKKSKVLELLELDGAGHSFGSKEKKALEAVRLWIARSVTA